MSCNDLARLAGIAYPNLLANPDFIANRAGSSLPWQLNGDVRSQSSGGLLGTGKLVFGGSSGRVYQAVLPACNFMPYDNEYRDNPADPEHPLLHPNNDIFRAVYIVCSGTKQVMARVWIEGRSDPVETEYYNVAPDGDSEVDSRIRMGDWRLHRLRYWDTATAEIEHLQGVEIEAREGGGLLEVNCVYLPGVDVCLTVSLELAAQAHGYASVAEWLLSELDSGSERRSPEQPGAPAWAQAMMLQFGTYMVRTENKIDRLMGALKTAESLKNSKKSKK